MKKFGGKRHWTGGLPKTLLHIVPNQKESKKHGEYNISRPGGDNEQTLIRWLTRIREEAYNHTLMRFLLQKRWNEMTDHSMWLRPYNLGQYTSVNYNSTKKFYKRSIAIGVSTLTENVLSGAGCKILMFSRPQRYPNVKLKLSADVPEVVLTRLFDPSLRILISAYSNSNVKLILILMVC